MENFPVRPPKTTVRPHLLEKLIKITINGQILVSIFSNKKACCLKQASNKIPL